MFCLACSDLITASTTPGDIPSTFQFTGTGSLGAAGIPSPAGALSPAATGTHLIPPMSLHRCCRSCFWMHRCSDMPFLFPPSPSMTVWDSCNPACMALEHKGQQSSSSGLTKQVLQQLQVLLHSQLHLHLDQQQHCCCPCRLANTYLSKSPYLPRKSHPHNPQSAHPPAACLSPHPPSCVPSFTPP